MPLFCSKIISYQFQSQTHIFGVKKLFDISEFWISDIGKNQKLKNITWFNFLHHRNLQY